MEAFVIEKLRQRLFPWHPACFGWRVNNLVENAIRPTAVGKKNWLFVGEAGAGQRGAIIYSIIETCRRRKIDPDAYLRDVLSRLPRMTNHQIPEITPEAWAKTRQRLQRQAAS